MMEGRVGTSPLWRRPGLTQDGSRWQVAGEEGEVGLVRGAE